MKLKSPKFAPGLRARAIWKSKSLKSERFGQLFEVELRKICTTPARESDSEVKSVKAPGARTTLQNTWQAQALVRVAKMLAGAVDLKRVLNDAFRVVGVLFSLFSNVKPAVLPPSLIGLPPALLDVGPLVGRGGRPESQGVAFYFGGHVIHVVS